MPFFCDSRDGFYCCVFMEVRELAVGLNARHVELPPAGPHCLLRSGGEQTAALVGSPRAVTITDMHIIVDRGSSVRIGGCCVRGPACVLQSATMPFCRSAEA